MAIGQHRSPGEVMELFRAFSNVSWYASAYTGVPYQRLRHFWVQVVVYNLSA